MVRDVGGERWSLGAVQKSCRSLNQRRELVLAVQVAVLAERVWGERRIAGPVLQPWRLME